MYEKKIPSNPSNIGSHTLGYLRMLLRSVTHPYLLADELQYPSVYSAFGFSNWEWETVFPRLRYFNRGSARGSQRKSIDMETTSELLPLFHS
jgi:hypothetical protein